MGVHHAWGRTYKDAYNRYFAMTGHELRYQNGFDCQGLWVEVEVEKELGPQDQARHREPRPGDVASIDQFVQRVQGPRRQVRPRADRAVDPPRLLDGLGPHSTAGLGEDTPGRAASRTSRCREREQLHDLDVPQEVPRTRLIYRGYDAMPWCGRCGVGISEQEMEVKATSSSSTSRVFVKLPAEGTATGREPARLDDDALDADEQRRRGGQPGADYVKLKVKRDGEVYYVAKEQPRIASGWRRRSRKASGRPEWTWLDGVPQLKSHRADLQGRQGRLRDRRRGQGRRHGRLGVRRARSTTCRRSSTPDGFPEEVAIGRSSGSGWCHRRRRRRHASSPAATDVSETKGTGIVHIAPGCGDDRLSVWARATACRRSRRSTKTACSSTASARSPGKNAVDPATAELVFEDLKKKDLLFASKQYSAPLSALLAVQDELLFRLVDEWFINMDWREEIMKRRRRQIQLAPPRASTARPASWTGSANMGDWMISKKRFWGLALPIWVDDEDRTTSRSSAAARS